jgi:hypothetical protein
MAIRTELNLRLPNSPGAVAAVCRALADERVNILAMSVESTGQMRLVVDNHIRAAGALRERHHQVTEREVLLAVVGSGPGALAPVLALAADAGINVEYAYGTSTDGPGRASIVLGVENAARAAAVAGI